MLIIIYKLTSWAIIRRVSSYVIIGFLIFNVYGFIRIRSSY